MVGMELWNLCAYEEEEERQIKEQSGGSNPSFPTTPTNQLISPPQQNATEVKYNQLWHSVTTSLSIK